MMLWAVAPGVRPTRSVGGISRSGTMCRNLNQAVVGANEPMPSVSRKLTIAPSAIASGLGPTRFAIAAAETVAAAVPATSAHARSGKTVLVVDDEPSVRMLVTEVLEELGYIPVEASDGPAGLRMLQSDMRVDLLVTDVGLPGGINGRQLADAARTTRPDLRVLFITGYAENAIIGNGHLAPNMGVLTKPFVMETLARRIIEMTGDES